MRTSKGVPNGDLIHGAAYNPRRCCYISCIRSGRGQKGVDGPAQVRNPWGSGSGAKVSIEQRLL
jgi:hypothetical protein